MKRVALLLFACTPRQEPATIPVAASATATATASATASVTATASESFPPLDLSKCGSNPGCKWSVGYEGRCSGVALRAIDDVRSTQVCVCNGCLADSDCTAKPNGKCETFPLMCRPQAKACTYPGDLCRDRGENACEKQMGTGSGPPMHKACYHDGAGHVACSPFQWPPP